MDYNTIKSLADIIADELELTNRSLEKDIKNFDNNLNEFIKYIKEVKVYELDEHKSFELLDNCYWSIKCSKERVKCQNNLSPEYLKDLIDKIGIVASIAHNIIDACYSSAYSSIMAKNEQSVNLENMSKEELINYIKDKIKG